MSLFGLLQRHAARRNARRINDHALARIAHLRAMSPADLADIGLKPGDVPAVERQIRSRD